MPAASPPGFTQSLLNAYAVRCEACGPWRREVGESDPDPLVLSATAVRACECKCAPSVHAVCTCEVERNALTLQKVLCLHNTTCTLVCFQRTMHVDAERYAWHCLLTTSLRWRWGLKARTTETRWGTQWRVPADSTDSSAGIV